MFKKIKPPKLKLPKGCSVDAKWYRLEIQQLDGTWKDAGDVYEEETVAWCVKEMCWGNFFMGEKVRMVEHFHAFRPIGKVRVFDWNKRFKRKRK